MVSRYLPKWIDEPWVSPGLRAWLEVTAATIGNVGLDEPATIDKRLDTNTVTRGAETVHRENICIADETTIEAFARVVSAVPTTEAGLVVRQVNMRELDYDSGAGTVNLAIVGVALPGAGGPVVGGDATTPFRVDPTGTTTQPVNDAGGSITVDAPAGTPVNVQIGDGTDTALVNAAGDLQVTLAGEVVEIDEGANALEVVGDVAHDAAVAGNPVLLGVEARSASPTAVASGDVVRLIADLLGKQIVLPFANPENFVEGSATLTGTGDVSIIAAAGAGVRNYVTECSGSNTSGTAVRVDIKDGTTIKRSFFLAASGGGFVWNSPYFCFRGTANTAVQMALSAAVTDVRVGASGYTAP